MTYLKRLTSLVMLGFAFACVVPPGNAVQNAPAKYMKTPTGYLMVLRHGDNVLQNLEQLAQAENIPSASFVGIGFMSEATFGFYDFGRKQFDPKTFRNVEMANNDRLHCLERRKAVDSRAWRGDGRHLQRRRRPRPGADGRNRILRDHHHRTSCTAGTFCRSGDSGQRPWITATMTGADHVHSYPKRRSACHDPAF